jgi:transcriptional regulator with PAS, ATPase and Fis domain
MPLEMQAKLLMFIQKRSFYRVGGNVEIHVNVRIIAATNKNIEDEIKQKRFREDLFYRLNILPIYIESLKNRREDLGKMIEHVMEKYNKTFNEYKILSAQANKMLLSYDYPGNVRELENVIERAFVLSEGKIIYPEHLMLKNKNAGGSLQISGKTLDQIMDDYERDVILEALKLNENNHIKTFGYLGIGKTCFYSKLKKYGI